MKFNGVDAASIGLKIKDIQRSVLAPVNNRFYQQKNSERIYDFGSTLGTMKIDITFHVKGQTSKTNLQNVLRDAAAWLYPVDKQAKNLELDQDSGLHYLAKLDGSTDLSEILYYGYFTASFICLIPYKIGSTRVAATTTSAVNILNVTNIGTAEAPMIITIHFDWAATYARITNQLGKFIWVTAAMPAGGDMIIDTDKQNITIAGVNNLQNMDLTSRFFNLKVGLNTFTVTPNPFGKVTVAYDPRYY